MNPSIGYFSLIQYLPDPSRLEAANIGVLLFAPQLHYLKAMTVGDNRRIARFFGREGHDWVRVNSFKKGIEERVETENATVRTLEDLEKFIAQRANQFRITDPRAMKVRNPDKELRDLFAELVGGKPRTGRQRQSFRSFRRHQFAQAGLDRKLATDIRIEVPTFDREVAIPYGYQNGRFNLIQPARFESKEASQAISSACRFAVEGRSLYHTADPKLGQLQLIVVGQFLSRKANNRMLVQRILAENEVKLIASTEIEHLIADIRDNGKEINPSA